MSNKPLYIIFGIFWAGYGAFNKDYLFSALITLWFLGLYILDKH